MTAVVWAVCAASAVSAAGVVAGAGFVAGIALADHLTERMEAARAGCQLVADLEKHLGGGA